MNIFIIKLEKQLRRLMVYKGKSLMVMTIQRINLSMIAYHYIPIRQKFILNETTDHRTKSNKQEFIVIGRLLLILIGGTLTVLMKKVLYTFKNGTATRKENG